MPKKDFDFITPDELAALEGAVMRSDGCAGIACPKCGCRDFRVIETSRIKDAMTRRRSCRRCGRRITTREKLTKS